MKYFCFLCLWDVGAASQCYWPKKKKHFIPVTQNMNYQPFGESEKHVYKTWVSLTVLKTIYTESEANVFPYLLKAKLNCDIFIELEDTSVRKKN